MKVDKNDPDPQPEGGLARNLTRRTWLQHVGWISAAAAFPQLARAAANDISPVMDKLSSFMAEARNRALPENVVQETKHHILDTIAAMISGSELPPGRMAIQFARCLRRQTNCDSSGLGYHVRANRSSICQW